MWRQLLSSFDLEPCQGSSIRVLDYGAGWGTTLLRFFSVPDYRDENLEAQLSAFREGRPVEKELNPWEHLNYFMPRSLREALSRSGFEEVSGVAAGCDASGTHRKLGQRVAEAVIAAKRLFREDGTAVVVEKKRGF